MQALDLDEVAVQSAKLNIKLNKVHDIVTVSQNNLLEGIDEEAGCCCGQYFAEVILRFTDDVAKTVKQGGYFIASGIIQAKKDQVKEAIEKAGFEISGNTCRWKIG